jgi:hypothetical protein
MANSTNSDIHSSSEDSMYANNQNIMQFEITDNNGNCLKYSTPTTTKTQSFNQQVFIEQKTNEAMQLQMANEEEVGNELVGISVLPNETLMPTTPVTSSCFALSTSVPTFVNLPTYQVQGNSMIHEFYDQNNDQAMKELDDLLMTDNFDNDIKSTLKSITADAGKFNHLLIY